jgi:peptide/nickel transport system substrate-binding protein
MMIRIRNDISPFDDQRVRLALNLAVNVDAIIRAIMKGFAVPLQAQTIGEGVTGWDPDTKALPYDPDRARALLKEAGVKPGLRVRLDATKGRWGNDLEVCTAVAGELRRVGIDVDVVVNESGEYTDKHAGRKEFAPLFIRSSGNIIPDIENGINDMIRLPARSGYFHSKQLEDLFAKLQVTADPAARRALSKQVAKVMSTEIPAIFLFNYKDIYGVRNHVDWTPRVDQYIMMNEVRYRSV